MQKKEYELIQQQFSLPPFESMDKYFDISSIEETSGLLRKIRHNIKDTLNELITLISTILQPDPNLYVDLYESTAFTEEDKKIGFELLKHCMILYRELDYATFSYDDKKDADTIKKAHQLYPALAQRALPFITILRDAWNNATEAEKEGGYFV